MNEEEWMKLVKRIEEMEKTTMRWLLGITLPILIVAGAYGYGYQAGSKKVPEKETKIQYVDRVVEKEVKVYVKQAVKQEEKKTVTKPDGTTIVTEKKTETQTEVDGTSKEKSKEKEFNYDSISNSKSWRAGIMAGIPIANWREMEPVYGGHLDHKIAGRVSGGAWYIHSQDKLAGVSISLEF